LKELEIARANAARRELAINAALQASQLLVAITGAIAKIATPGIGPAEVIAGIATIVGALAAGYGIVKTLQSNQPQFFKGTTSVKRDGQPAGRDTIPAWLTEGEAVIPVDKNNSYKKSVEAIYHGKVPADVMNEFVENYINNKTESKNVNNIINNIINKDPGKSVNVIKSKSEKESIFKTFSESVNQVPEHILENFVSKYYEQKILKQNTASILEKISEKNIVSKEILDTITSKHVEKGHVSIPNYKRIKDSAEHKNTSDAGMVKVMKEQNQLIRENNELNLQTIKVLKSMGVNVNLDKDGLAISIMEAADKMKINRRV